jgi:hypothetical protein
MDFRKVDVLVLSSTGSVPITSRSKVLVDTNLRLYIPLEPVTRPSLYVANTLLL